MMKLSADYRSAARAALKNRWALAVAVGLVASILFGVADSGFPDIEFELESGHFSFGIAWLGKTLVQIGPDIGWRYLLAGLFWYVIILGLVVAALRIILGGIIEVGYARFNLELTSGGDASFNHLFAYFNHWKSAACTRLLRGVYVFLFSLLLVVPGIIAAFNYAMADYILAEHPELKARDVLKISTAMMKGNRWRLFCLEISFIGWAILCAFTFGIGNLFLRPYTSAAVAAFYRDLTYERPFEEIVREIA